ncbi:MAG: cell division protein FtsA [Candidatus Berkelbacteria bacterium]
MSKDNTLVGIDIGTTKVAITVGRVDEGLINVIGFSRVSNAGMRRGIITDVEDTVSAVTSALEEAERVAGIPITNAYVSIGGAHISSIVSKGVVAVSRADGEISASDVNRVIEAAQTVALPPNREIVHVIPKYYIIDGQDGITDPIGMSGIRLEVEAVVVGGATSSIKNLAKCLQQTGVAIDGMVFAPLAAAHVLINKKQKEMGVALVDIGGGTTSIAVFENGDIIHCAVLPVGSMHITNDIAIGLRTSLEVAEKIKTNYGSAMPENISASETINLANLDPQDAQKVERKYVCEIIHARLMEIFSMVHDELRKIGKDGMLPAGIVFTGGGSNLEDLVTLAKEELRLPAQIGMPLFEMSGLVDKIDPSIYSTSTGLILHGLENQHSTSSSKLDPNDLLDKAKGFFKQFLP